MLELKHPLSEGELIAGNYRVLGIAGSGGMGVVYKALDIHLERIVALKFLPAELDASARDHERFLREARTASSLDHPNIGVIYGVESTGDGRSFIVMAFYDGNSLAERVHSGALSAVQAVEIALQMAEGLAEAHRRNIVHRDIKPSNVMLTTSGFVKIVDFGLAQMVSVATASNTGTTGTVAYMSPEQALGRPVDGRADIWALGVVLAEMLISSNPFCRETIPGILFAILNEPPRGLDAVPSPLLPILYRCLAKDADKRYSSGAGLIEDLRAARLQLPSPAVEPKPSMAKTIREASFTRRARQEASRSAWLGPLPRRSMRTWLRTVPAAMAGLAIIVALALWLAPGMRNRLLPSLAGAQPKHLAVLPFDTIGSTPESSALAAGLMDSLTGQLSDLKVGQQSLWVVPDSEVRRLKITDPEEALRKLHADLVVKGTVERESGSVQLHLNLIDTKNLRQLGSVEVQNQGGDLANIENDAVDRLARLMNISVTPNMLPSTGGSVAPAAYEDYLTALGYIHRYDKAGNLDRAVTVLQQAIATDPRFALGYAELGETYRLKYRTTQDEQALAEAETNCRKAIEIDQKLPGPYVTLGRIHNSAGQYDLALQEFQQALDLDPRDARAITGMAHADQDAGRLADAEAAFQKAINLRPGDWDGYNSLALFLQQQGKYPEAVVQYKQALALSPENAQVLVNLGGAYSDEGIPHALELAQTALQSALRVSPSYGAYANLGGVYYREHHYGDAVAATEHALRMNNANYVVWENLRTAEEWLGNSDAARSVASKERPVLMRYVAAHPQDASAQIVAAGLLGRYGAREQALVHMRTALALSPNDPQILEAAAATYENLGQRSNAVKFMNAAFDRGLPYEQAADDPEVRNLLKEPAVHALRGQQRPRTQEANEESHDR